MSPLDAGMLEYPSALPAHLGTVRKRWPRAAGIQRSPAGGWQVDMSNLLEKHVTKQVRDYLAARGWRPVRMHRVPQIIRTWAYQDAEEQAQAKRRKEQAR